MAIEKTMKTRIVLTHDEYEALKGKTLKYGEVVLAKVGSTNGNSGEEPIWMMKVGKQGNATTVENSPWLVAPAADVYSWAKKENLDVTDVPALPIEKITGLTEALAGKSDSGHNHDDVYKKLQTAVAESGAADKTLKISQNANGEITVTPVDIAIAQTQVTGLVDALAGKADKEHNHKAADLTDFTADVTAVVNGLGITTEGVQDLATRLGTAEGEIDALQTAVNTTLPGQIATKVEQEAYNTKVAALEKADTDEAAARVLLDQRVAALEADDTTKTYVDTELAKKVDKTTYDEKVQALEKADTDLDTAVKAAQNDATIAKTKIETFLGTVTPDGSAEIIDTLTEINNYVGEHGEEFATLSGKVTAIENGTTVVPKASDADTLDGKHADAFATKEQGAKADTALQAADIAGKMDKITDYIQPGNFLTAELDADRNPTGNVIATEYNSSSFADVAHQHIVADITDYATDVAAKIKVETDARVEALSGKIDKLTSANGNNFLKPEVGSDGKLTGNLVDSGFSPSDFQPAGNYKLKQDAETFTGATGKTITSIAQNEDGAIEVEYNDIAITASQVTDLDVGVKSVTVDESTGLKATTTNGAVNIGFIDDVVFVLDGGTAADLI